MNSQLLNPFAQDIPDSVEAILEHAGASCIRINPSAPLGVTSRSSRSKALRPQLALPPLNLTCPSQSPASASLASSSSVDLGRPQISALFAGQYLAAGRQDGAVAVWDIETRSILRWLEGHVKLVTSVSWSPLHRYLASSSLDSTVIIWDLSRESEQRVRTIRFDAPVLHVEFSPSSSKKLIVLLESQRSYLIHLRHTSWSPEETLRYPSAPLQSRRLQLPSSHPTLSASEQASSSFPLTAICYHPGGEHIFMGTSKGGLIVQCARSLRVIYMDHHIVGSSAVKAMAFDKSGRHLVANSNDRTVRLFSVRLSHHGPDRLARHSSMYNFDRTGGAVEVTLVHKVQDLVNRTPWLGVGFSSDGEYSFAGAAHKAAHNIYVWDRSSGRLSKILEGPKESLVAVDWHPNRPLLVSVSTSGAIHVWSTQVTEIWSAYAPGFQELEENVEYEEREDEFDIEDEDELTRRKLDEEDAPVDVFSSATAPHSVSETARAQGPAVRLADSVQRLFSRLDDDINSGVEEDEGNDDDDDDPCYFLPLRLEKLIPARGQSVG